VRGPDELAVTHFFILCQFGENSIHLFSGESSQGLGPDVTPGTNGQAKRGHGCIVRCIEYCNDIALTAKEFFWTLGSYDVVAIFDAPDDASMTALGLAIGAGGNVRTQTLRAFSREEMNGVLAKLA